MNYEDVIMGLIAHAGNAKSLSMEAIKQARTKDFAKSKELLEKANVEFLEAHKIQTDLITNEISGNGFDVTLLMVHAQDHLMSALTIKDLAEEIIELHKLNKEG